MYKNFVKRIADIILSFVALVLTAIPMLIVAIVIKIESKGPVIFKQERVGKNGKVYWMYKFRSMCIGAEQMEEGVYCEKGDRRVTKVGKFIRATSIDELPQFINIIKGDMSLIGPRPVLTYYPKQWEEYTEEELKRFDVRPGVTGWAQINGRDELEIPVKAKLDGEYTAALNSGCFKGFAMDIKCLLGTIISVLKSDGVVEGGTGEIKKQEERKKEIVGK